MPVLPNTSLPGDTVFLDASGKLPAVDGSNLTGVADYAGRFEGPTIGTGDIGLNKWGWWYDTTNSRLLLVRNRSGVLFAVQGTPL